MRAALLTILILLVPLGHAAPWDPVEITLPPIRIGDLTRFSLYFGPNTTEHVVFAEGPSRAIDEWGIEHETFAFQVESYENAELRAAERCHFLSRGYAVVSAELLAGEGYGSESMTGAWRGGDILVGDISYDEESVGVQRFGGGLGCAIGPDLFARESLREGGQVLLSEVTPHEYARPLREGDRRLNDTLSSPARAETWLGRDALAFAFRVEDTQVEIEFVYADGIHGAVSWRLRAPNGTQVIGELTGFTPGTGAEVRIGGPERIATRNPTARMIPYDPLGFDDSSLNVPFPYADAFKAVSEDRESGGAAWLAAHPEAYLTYAVADTGIAAETPTGMEGRPGSWLLSFSDGAQESLWVISSGRRTETPLGPVDLSVPLYQVTQYGIYEARSPVPPLPTHVASDSSLKALATSAGIDPLAPRLVYWFHGWSDGDSTMRLTLTDVDQGREDTDGRSIHLDPRLAAIEIVSATRYTADPRPGLLPSVKPFTETGPEAAGHAMLPSPGSVSAAAVAVTGLALLALAVKFLLLPLYTRLVRDRLLDNPVRARLYDHVRSNPGVHLAELEELLGVGKGATKHHVDQLARHRFVFVIEDAGKARCYAAGHIPIDVARRHALLQAGSHQRVYDLLRAEPALSLRAAAERLGMSAPSVHKVKRKLQDEGLLARGE